MTDSIERRACGARAWPRIALGAVLAAAPGAAALAQTAAEAEIEEVFVTAGLSPFGALKTDTPIMALARSISIETQRDLLDKGALNLADAYVYSAGVAGERYGFATRGDWVAVRGLQVPEYRDSLQALFGSYNNTRPDIYTLEQVEILKGPASVLYGQGSPGGIVNVVSKLAGPGVDSELIAEFGNFKRYQLAADVNFALTDELYVRLLGVYRDTDTQVDPVFEKAITFAPSLTWTPGERTTLTLLANIQETDSDTGAQFHPVAGTLTPAPNGAKIPFDAYTGEPGFNAYDTQSESLTLLFEQQWGAIWSIESTARWTEGSSDYRQAWVAFTGGDRYVYHPDGTLYRGGLAPRSFYAADGRSEQRAIDTRARARFSTGPVDHHVMLGLQYQDVETDRNVAYLYALGFDRATRGPDRVFGDRFWINSANPRPTGFPSRATVAAARVDNPAATTSDLGIYLNNHLSIERWRLALGLRRDAVSTDNGRSKQDDQASSFGAGILYESDLGLSPYVSYAESFEPVVGVDNITGAALKPEQGEQLEYGIKYASQNGRLFVTLAAFDIEIGNLSNPNALPNANSQQEGVSKLDGVELETRLRLGDVSLELNASRIDTRDPNGRRFASVPERQASAWLSWRPQGVLQGLRGGVGVRYTGRSFDGADTLATPSYTLGDLMLGYTLRHWDLTLNVRNAADKTYLTTCLARGDCFVGERRSVVGRVVYRF